MTAKQRLRPLLAALALALLVAGTVAAPAQARRLQTGFLDDDSFYNAPTQISELWLSRATAAGASLVRLNVYWNTIAPKRPSAGFNAADPSAPGYEWNRLDDSVREAVAHGLTPILTVLDAPTWAEGPGRKPGAATGTWRPNAAALAEFARALASRYDGSFPDPEDPAVALPRVSHFQAWNEPNLYYYLNPQYERGHSVSPTIYRALLNAFYPAIKSVQPSATVLAAGLAPIGHKNAVVGPLAFMRQLTCMSGGVKPHPVCSGRIEADVWATHPYTTGGPEHSAIEPNDVSLGDLPQMVALLRAADRYRHVRGKHARTPFWVTEFSWDTRPPDPGGVPMAIDKRWVSAALYRMWSAGASAVIWLTICDAPNPRHASEWGSTYQSGFYRYRSNPYRSPPKPSLQAFRFPFVAIPNERGSVRVWGRTPTSRPGLVVLQSRDAGTWRTVGSIRAGGGGIFSGSLREEDVSGAVRAYFGSEVSIPFSLRPVRDRYVRPFGGSLPTRRSSVAVGKRCGHSRRRTNVETCGTAPAGLVRSR